MAIPKNVATIAVLITLTASGCTQPDPNAKPTYTCTPSDGGTPRPCYKAEYELQTKEDALYAEAEAVYRKYIAEDERIYRAGGVTAATPTLTATLTGPALTQALDTYRDVAATSTRAVGGAFKIRYLHRAPQSIRAGSVAAVEACIDSTSVVFRSTTSNGPGGIGLERSQFSLTPNGLRISDFDHFEGTVTSCE
ncbi:MAG: hypothetical protein K4304_05410 [Propionicimonas sp.]